MSGSDAGSPLRRTACSDRGEVGEGWHLPCLVCEEPVVTGPGGICSECGTELMHELPAATLPAVRDPIPPPPALLYGRRACANAARLLATTFLAAGFTVGSNVMMLALRPMALVALFGAAVGILVVTPVCAVLLELARQLELMTYWGPARPLDPRLRLEDVRHQVVERPEGRAVVVHVGLGARDPSLPVLDVVARVRGPDGHYLRALDPALAGDHGEVQIRKTAHRIEDGRDGRQAARLVLPMGSFAAPPSAYFLELTVELLVVDGDEVLAERDVDVWLEPRPEELPLELAAA